MPRTEANTFLSANAAFRLIKSLSIGALGGALFDLLGLPLAWMLGPLVTNLIASISTVQVAVPENLRLVFLGVLGLALGSQVTPALVERVVDWPVSGALLLIGVAVSTSVCAAWFRRRGFDPVTAWFSAAPGAMTAMIMMGEACGGDPRRVAISQSLRIILVLLILPPLFWLYESGGGSRPTAPGEDTFSAAYLLLTLPLLIPIGMRLRIPTPALLVPLLFSALLSGFSIARFQMPTWGMNVMLLVLGCAIGSRFRGLSLSLLRKHLFESVIATSLLLLILALFAELVHWILGVPRDVALLAMAPGGIGELAILAVALNLDPMFVAFHHLLRIVALMAVAPLWARFLTTRRS
ncbi:AbrB family transcriptional regulator [Marinobacter sp. JSM 1782161]|uniref:AbrB family transcriptional regulator n=1 Tax=Marinobacter sp. JSM 1782161 TaxID=2685906 RepID=UPI001402A0CB|nr:AbrB family transcriptional regulator [Marinobacter sp. JSM 1782161]